MYIILVKRGYGSNIKLVNLKGNKYYDFYLLLMHNDFNLIQHTGQALVILFQNVYLLYYVKI